MDIANQVDEAIAIPALLLHVWTWFAFGSAARRKQRPLRCSALFRCDFQLKKLGAIMASSTLDPDNIPEPDRQPGKGHGTDALGPSDISDSGSDVQGGLRAVEDLDLGLDRGTNEDSDSHNIAASSDSDDSTGTGESSTAGRNSDVELSGDIGFDRVDDIDLDIDPDAEDTDRPPPSRETAPQQHKR
jgi:hypothetical protein